MRTCGCNGHEWCRVCENVPRFTGPGGWTIVAIVCLTALLALLTGCSSSPGGDSPGRAIAGVTLFIMASVGMAHVTSPLSVCPRSSRRQKRWAFVLIAVLMMLFLSGCDQHAYLEGRRRCAHVSSGRLAVTRTPGGWNVAVLVTRVDPDRGYARVQYEGFTAQVDVLCDALN